MSAATGLIYIKFRRPNGEEFELLTAPQAYNDTIIGYVRKGNVYLGERDEVPTHNVDLATEAHRHIAELKGNLRRDEVARIVAESKRKGHESA